MTDVTAENTRKELNNMALKKLSQFEHFDEEGFFSRIGLVVIGKSIWKEYGTNLEKGTAITTVIASDRHNYNASEGEIVNNLYEKIVVKIPKKIDVVLNAKIKLVNPQAKIYGEYRNLLSVTADDVEILGK